MRSPGGGELSLSACPGVGKRPPSENKIANPRGYAGGGGMVTGRIEPCIIANIELRKGLYSSIQIFAISKLQRIVLFWTVNNSC